MRNELVLMTLLGCALAQCAHRGAGPSMTTPEATTTTTSTTVFALDAGDGRAPFEIDVREAEGLPKERVESIFAPAVESLARCFPGTGGKITVHVTTKNGRLHLDIDPSALLDASSRACAESVLTNVYREQTG